MTRHNPERARQLRERGYTPSEIAAHMVEEGRDVDVREVRAWLNHSVPPVLYPFEGGRHTLAQIARRANVGRELLAARIRRGMSIADAITCSPASPSEAARTAKSPWRSNRSCPCASMEPSTVHTKE